MMKVFLFFFLFLACLNSKEWNTGDSDLSNKDKINRENEIINNILSECGGTGLTKLEIKEIVHFIENYLSNFIAYQEFYVDRKRTDLPCDIEYDPSTGFVFIHLDRFYSKPSKNKVLSKAIQYDIKNPKIVAVLTSQKPGLLEKEIEVLRQLQGVSRTVQLVGAPVHSRNNQLVQKMILPFYVAGDLNLKMKLSVKEKIILATDLMEALKGAHDRGITHGDLHKGNLLLEEFTEAKQRGIRYRLVVIDWESSKTVEGFSYHKRKDLYRAACTIYGLFHDEKYKGSLFARGDRFERIFADGLVKSDSKDLILGEISKEITKRKKELDKRNKEKSVTLQEEFEWIILCMMHPTYQGNEDAEYWYNEFKKLM